MRALLLLLGSLIGMALTIADMIGIVVGFTVSFPSGLIALLFPPYGVYLGIRAVFGA